MPMKIRFVLATAMLVASAVTATKSAQAQGLALIRDAEIESIIKAYSAPIFQSAGLTSTNITVHLVQDPRLNAFVAGGRHMFINTGLLMRAEHAGQVIGVIAHETGHIAGGHLVRMQRELEAAQIRQVIALILSVGAAVGTRNPGAAVAGVGLGARLTEGTFYQFTRVQESAADAFALATLDRIGVSSRGLYEFLQVLSEQEALYLARQDPYMRTHPLTRDRVDEVKRHLERSPSADKPLPRNFAALHTRMRAKLIGFLRPPEQVIALYRGRENTLEARYALAVAYFRDSRFDQGLTFIDALLKESPNDPYFNELKGELLFNAGRPKDAVPYYERAVRAAPGEGLIRVGLGQSMLESHETRYDRAALSHLAEAVRRDDTYPLAWRLLSAAYGRVGDHGNSALALAEYAYLSQDLPTLRAAVARAERQLKPGTPSYQRLLDIKAQVAQIMKDRRDR